jgi:hypothetical protein
MRSPSRPVVVIVTAPRAAPPAYRNPSADWVTPWSPRCSGISTCSVPPISATSRIRMKLTAISRSDAAARSAGRKLDSRSAGARASGSSAPHTASSSEQAANARKVLRVPTAPATTPPSTGPAIIPPVAEALAIEMPAPRRCSGVRAASHARPALQATAEATPCATRAANSTSNELPTANAAVAAHISSEPATFTFRMPTRSARCPSGTAVTSTAPL